MIEVASHPKHRALMMTTYGTGLRVSAELCAFKVGDIDAARMSIRVNQGKDAKDRYTLLSARLLIAPPVGSLAAKTVVVSRHVPA